MVENLQIHDLIDKKISRYMIKKKFLQTFPHLKNALAITVPKFLKLITKSCYLQTKLMYCIYYKLLFSQKKKTIKKF